MDRTRTARRLPSLGLPATPLALAGATAAGPDDRQPPSALEARHKAAARRWTEELWGRGDRAVADEIVAPDYVRHDAGDPFPARGPEDVKRLVAMLRAMLPDLRLEIEDLIVAGDTVVTRYTGTATDTRGYLGRPPTGRRIRTPAIQIFRFRDGKIAESWAVRDDLGPLVQLGHLPPPAAPVSPRRPAADGPAG